MHPRTILKAVVGGISLSILSFGVFSALAFNGPSSNAGAGVGALGVGTANNISVGTSTPLGNTELLIVASSTGTSSYAAQIQNSAQSPLFVVRNDGSVALSTSSFSSGATLSVNGTIFATNAFTGTISAGNVTPGVFNGATGGNYAFNGSLGVATTSQVGLPQSLSVYGNGYFSGNVDVGAPSATSSRLNFGTPTGAEVINYWDGGAASRYGTGIQASELQFYVPSGAHISFNTGGDLQTSGTNEVMRITSAGDVGIGTTTAPYPLTVNGDMQLTGNNRYIHGSSELYIAPAGGQTALYDGTTNEWFQIYNGGTAFVNLASGGSYINTSIGIATTSAAYTLNVNGNGNFTQPVVVGTPTLATQAATKGYVDAAVSGGSGPWTASGTNVYTSVSSSNVGIGTSSPSGFFNVVRNSYSTGITIDSASFTTDAIDLRQLGSVVADWAYDGQMQAWQGSYLAPGYTFYGDTNTGIFDNGLGHNIQFSNNGAQTAVLTSGGDFGIGTTTPNSSLDVINNDAANKYGVLAVGDGSQGNTVNLARFSGEMNPVNGAWALDVEPTLQNPTASDFRGLYIKQTTAAGATSNNIMGIYIDNPSISGAANNRYSLYSADTDNSYFAGNVGIGTSSPSDLLDVFSTGQTQVDIDAAAANQAILQLKKAGASEGRLYVNNANATILEKSIGANNLIIDSSSNINLNSGGFYLSGGGNASFTQPVYVGTPTVGGQAATKSYVDTAVSGAATQWSTNGANLYPTITTSTVSLGTSSAQGILNIYASSGAVYYFGDNNSTLRFVATGGANYIESGSSSAVGNSRADIDFTSMNDGVPFMTIQGSTGNVGIGNTSPSGALVVQAPTDSAAADQFLKHSGVSVLDVDTLNGRVGIGTNAPSAQLAIASGTASMGFTAVPGSPSFIIITNGTETMNVGINGNLHNEVTSQSNNPLYFAANNTEFMALGPTGGLGLGTTYMNTDPGMGNMIIQNNLAIATTSTSSVLNVNGTGSFTQPVYVGTPTVAGQAATKGYVDTAISGGGGPWTVSGSNIYTTNTSTNVGIGTTSPGSPLEVDYTRDVSSTESTVFSLNNLLSAESQDLIFGFGGTQAITGANTKQIDVHGGSGSTIINFNDQNADNATGTAVELALEAGTAVGHGVFIKAYPGQTGDLFTVASSSGTGTSFFRVLGGGNVVVNNQLAIGNTSPAGSIDIGQASDNTDKSIILRYSSVPQFMATTYDGTTYAIGAVSVNSRPTAATYTASNNSSYDNLYDEIEAATGNNGRFIWQAGNATTGVPTVLPLMTLTHGGNLGIATTSPAYNLDVNGTGRFTQPIYVGTPTVGGQAATKAYVDTAVGGGGAGSFSTLAVSGAWSLSGAASGSLNMNGFNISGVNKLTVTTVDPVYAIAGARYATYGPESIGITVTADGKGDLQKDGSGRYTSAIDFGNAEQGSDLWLFWQTIDQGQDMQNIDLTLTPEGGFSELWYDLVPSQKTIVVHGDRPATFSYHLSAPRYDASQWPNAVTAGETQGVPLQEK